VILIIESFRPPYLQGFTKMAKLLFFNIRVTTLVVLSIFSLLPGTEDNAIRYGGEMMRLPVGSDIAAMGDVGVVLPRHPTSVLWNPAASALLEKFELSIEGASLYEGLSHHGCFGFHAPIQTDIGGTILYIPFFSGPIERRNEPPENPYGKQNPDPNVSYFHNNHHLFLLALGKESSFDVPIGDAISPFFPVQIAFGSNFKWYWQTMNPDNKVRMGMNANLDVGVYITIGVDYDLIKKEISRKLRFGFTSRDLAPSKIIWIYSPENYQEPTTPSYYYGISYIDKSGMLAGAWTISLSLQKKYALTYHGGIEVTFWDIVSIRGGLSADVVTLGGGIQYKFLYIDYAFRFDTITYSPIRLTAGITF